MRRGLAGGDAPFDVVVHACGSGGTAAGVALGASQFGVAKGVRAMAVCDDAAYFERVIERIVLEARAWDASLGDPAPLVVDDHGEGARVRRQHAGAAGDHRARRAGERPRARPRVHGQGDARPRRRRRARRHRRAARACCSCTRVACLGSSPKAARLRRGARRERRRLRPAERGSRRRPRPWRTRPRSSPGASCSGPACCSRAAMFERNALAAVAVQAGVAEWGAGRMAIAWSDPAKPAPAWGAVAASRRDGRGARARWRRSSSWRWRSRRARWRSRAGEAGPRGPRAGAVRGGARRGARRAPPPRRGRAGDAVAAAGRPRSPRAVSRRPRPDWASTATRRARSCRRRSGARRSAPSGSIDRGAWMACGANAAWAWTLGAVLQGNLVDLRFANEAAVSAGVLAAGAALGAAVALKKSGRP